MMLYSCFLSSWSRFQFVSLLMILSLIARLQLCWTGISIGDFSSNISLYINKYLWDDTLVLCIYPVLYSTFSPFYLLGYNPFLSLLT